MKNKSIFMSFGLLVTSVGVFASDRDSLPSGGNSPEERSIAPHLDTSKIERGIMSAAHSAAAAQARIPLSQLHTVVKDNNLQAVTELIDSGVDVNSTGPLMMTALTMGAFTGCQLPILELLIRAGADVHACSFFGGSPLSNAIEKGNVEHARVLLAAGANANDRSVEGCFLKMAINRNQLEMATMLITAGATVSTDLLRRAIDKNNLSMVRLLVDAGVNVNDTDTNFSVLRQAQWRKNSEIIEFLRSRGAVITWGESCSIQ